MDEKLDHLFTETRAIREEISGLRRDMQSGFTGLRAEMAAMRADLSAQMVADRAQVAALHRQMLAMLGGGVVALIGLLGLWIAQG